MTRLVAEAVIRRAVLAAAGLAALLLWFLFRAPEGGAGRAAPPERSSAPAGAQLAPALAEDGELLTDDQASGERTPMPADVPHSEPPAPVRGAVVVRVVDAGGRPEARIPVALFAQVGALEAPLVQAETDDSGTAVLASEIAGKRNVSPDVRFSAGVDLPLEPPVRADLGPALPGPDDPARTVELVLPAGARAWIEPLRVQVVDQAGLPVAGARVEFRARLAFKLDAWSQLGVETTAPDGVASFARDQQREQMRRAAPMQLRFEFDVALSGPFAPEPRADVPALPSAEPVRLVLPPTGTVLARLRAADGTPVESGASMSLEWYAEGEDERGGHLSVEVAPGVTRFERVGLGLELRLGAWLAGGAAQAPAIALAGPVTAGEEVQVELQLGPLKPVLTGRVLDGDGRPRAGMPFALALRPLDPPPPDSSAGPPRTVPSLFDTTDAEGRFRIPWTPPLPAVRLSLCLLEQDPKGPPPGWIPLLAEAAFPALDPSGTELAAGDLVLREIPVIVAGRVVDVHGAPVNQAWLDVRYPAGEGEEEDWHNLDVVGSSRVATDAEGRFAVRTLDPVRALRLSASRNGLGSAPEQVVAPGTLDVQLTLEPEEDEALTRGEVKGSIRFDADVPLTEVEVYLRGAWGGHDTYPFGGVFRFSGVLPGAHSVVVRTADTHLELFTVEGVEVRAGEVTDDPRLADIDLRGRLRWLRLRLAGEDGEPVADEYVSLRVGKERGSVHTDSEGRLAALVRSEDDSFEVTADGFAPAAVGWSAGEQPVRLLRP